jgi:rare lipoprotein A
MHIPAKKLYIGITLFAAVTLLFYSVVVFVNDRYGSVGTASWYGEKWRGRKTASGEIFYPGRLTAAHRRLPFGTMAEVTNLGNGRKVTVKINDRGPYIRGRIIDLSRAAAAKLDMIEEGLAKVKIDILK